MGRWLTVRIVAWAMRRGLETAVIDEALRKSHRPWSWRSQVYEDGHYWRRRGTSLAWGWDYPWSVVG